MSDARTSGERRAEPGMMAVIVAMLGAIAAVTLSVLAGRAPIDATSAEPWPTVRVDLNQTDAVELTLLPGIGPGLADRIVADRAISGPFSSVEDLARVHGIGVRTIDGLAGLAVVAGGPSDRD